LATRDHVVPAESENPSPRHEPPSTIEERADYFRRSIVFNALRGGKFPRQFSPPAFPAITGPPGPPANFSLETFPNAHDPSADQGWGCVSNILSSK
jgi:hypothetical protein